MEGRGAQVDQQVDAFGHEFVHRIAIIERALEVVLGPDVLADRHPDAQAVPNHRLAGFTGLEISPLVEDIIGGQQGLPHPVGDPAILKPGGRVAERFPRPGGVVMVHVANQQRHGLGFTGKVIERLQALRHELRLEDQVARRISYQRQLGREHQLRAMVEALAVGG